MLDSLRKGVASIVVKALLVLLILSFVVWGIGDVVTPGGGDDWAAKVGDIEINAYDLGNEYQRERVRLRALLGDDIDAEQARELGLPGMVLNGMVDRTVIGLGAADLGFTAGDALVRQRIRSDERFFNQLNTFDTEIFNNTLRALGLTENGYVAQVRGEIIRSHLAGSLGAGLTVPAPLADRLYRHRFERRVAELLRIPDSSVEPPEVPGEPALRAFHQDNAPVFTAPEYRALTAVVIEAEDLADEIAVPQDELDEVFADRGDEFAVPERRRLRQMVLFDEEAAAKARSRLEAGEDFALVAREEAGLDAEVLEIEPLTRPQLTRDLGAEIAAAVFAAARGSATAPLQSPLGWHIVEVAEIEPGRTPPRAEIEETLRAEMALERAVDALFDLANRLEDALGGGASLGDAARGLALPVRRIEAIDGSGLAPDGTVVADLPAGLLETAFATEAGTESTLTETGSDGYFIVRVDSIAPPALKPFEDVREDVTKAWMAKRRGEVVAEAADAIAERARAGADFSTIAAQRDVEIEKTSPFNRNGAGAAPGMTADLVEALFAARIGEVVVGRGTRSSIVARLVDIVGADTGGQARANRLALSRQLASGIGGDLVAQLTAALRERYDVTVNTRVLDELY